MQLICVVGVVHSTCDQNGSISSSGRPTLLSVSFKLTTFSISFTVSQISQYVCHLPRMSSLSVLSLITPTLGLKRCLRLDSRNASLTLWRIYMANGLTNAVRHEFVMIANDRQTSVAVRKHSRSFLWCFECYAGLTSGECMANGLTNAIRH